MQKGNIQKILNLGLCHGCGVCSAVCPTNAISMDRVEPGIFQPHIDKTKCNECGTCLHVCSGKEKWGSDTPLGIITGVWMGYASFPEIRRVGASGGIVTGICSHLLSQGLIDGVVCCGPHKKTPFYPQSFIVKKPEKLLHCAKSIYGMTTIGPGLKRALEDENIKKLVVVGLPCQLASLRTAADLLTHLRKKVVFTIGLMDGHNVYHRATERDLLSLGLKPDNIRSYQYRASGWSPFNIEVVDRLNKTYTRVWKETLFSELWDNYQETPDCCMVCNDFSAEKSDIAVCDAWLPELTGNQEGYSIVATHTQIGRKIVESLIAESVLSLKKSTEEIIIRSQQNQVDFKKRTSSFRIAALGLKGKIQEEDAGDKLSISDKIKQLEIVYRNRNKGNGVPGVITALCFCNFLPSILSFANTVAKRLNWIKKRRSFPTLLSSIKSVPHKCYINFKIVLFNFLTTILFLVGRITIRPTKRANTCVILPPAPPGSLGDQAVMQTLVNELCKKGTSRICVIAYNDFGEWSFLSEVTKGPCLDKLEKMGGNFILPFWFLREITKFESFYVIGTDVLDGKYSERGSLQRLKLMEIAGKAGVDVKVVGFSFNETPEPSCVKALRDLPRGIILKSRDPLSKARIESRTHRQVILTADIAFLLEPNEDSETVSNIISWIKHEKKRGRIILGLNINHHLTCLKPKLSTDEILDKYFSVFYKKISQENISVIGIPHDYRGKVNDVTLLSDFARKFPSEISRHILLMPSPDTPGEIKTVCKYLDIVFSGKMHLAIASLGVGTPVGCMTYQDKFEGLFEHFDLKDCLIGVDEAMSGNTMEQFLNRIIEKRAETRQQINNRLPYVKELARRNL